MPKPKAQAIDVEIYDQKYSIVLKTSLGEDEVRNLADEVDTRMREIARAAGSADSLRVAILTALHLAQELHERDTLVETKTVEWSRALEQVLKK